MRRAEWKPDGTAARRVLAAALSTMLVAAQQGEAPMPPVVKAHLEEKAAPPGVDATILEATRTVAIGADGRVRERVRVVQKIWTDFAMDEYCDPRIRYNAAHQALEVVEAATWMRDGTRVETKENGKNLATPAGLDKAPAYGDVQELIVTHVGVEPGAITVLEYTLEDREPWRDVVFGSEPFRDEREVLAKTLEVRAPESVGLVFATAGAAPARAESVADGERVATFHATGMKGVNGREGGGGEDDALPEVFFARKADAGKAAATLFARAVEAGAGAAGDDGEKIVAQIDGELAAAPPASPLDRALALYRRIAQGVRVVEVDRGVLGWELRPPQAVFQSGYGDRFDILGTAAAAFARLGLSPKAIVTLRSDSDARLGHAGNVEGIWLMVNAYGNLLYLPIGEGEGGAGEPRPGKAYEVGAGGLTPAAFVKPAGTATRLDVVLDLRKAPASFTAELKLRGSANPYWGVFSAAGGEGAGAGEIVGGALAGMPLAVQKASFKRLALDESIAVATGTLAAKPGETLDVTLASAWHAGKAKGWELWRQVRGTPLVVEEKETVVETMTLLLPEGVAPDLAPPGSVAKGKAAVTTKLAIPAGPVLPGGYKEFKKKLETAFSPNSRRFIVKLPKEE